MNNELIELSIKEISLSQIKYGVYILLLEEEKSGYIKIPIIIDGSQAKSIAYVMSKKNRYNKYYIHDLFFDISKTFSINLRASVIYKLSNGIFFSYILFEKKYDQYKYKIESRTSDAIALAIRFQVPIYITKNIMDKVGTYFDDYSFYEVHDYHHMIKKNKFKNIENLKKMTKKDLNILLNQALNYEYYELAAKIKKELDSRYTN